MRFANQPTAVRGNEVHVLSTVGFVRFAYINLVKPINKLEKTITNYKKYETLEKTRTNLETSRKH